MDHFRRSMLLFSTDALSASLIYRDKSALEITWCRLPPLAFYMTDDQLKKKAWPPKRATWGQRKCTLSECEILCALIHKSFPTRPKILITEGHTSERDTSGSLALNFNVHFKVSIAFWFQTMKYAWWHECSLSILLFIENNTRESKPFQDKV